MTNTDTESNQRKKYSISYSSSSTSVYCCSERCSYSWSNNQSKRSRIWRKKSNTRCFSDSDFWFFVLFRRNLNFYSSIQDLERRFSVSLLHKIDLRENEDLTRKSESLKQRVWLFSRSGIDILGQIEPVTDISKLKTARGHFWDDPKSKTRYPWLSHRHITLECFRSSRRVKLIGNDHK